MNPTAKSIRDAGLTGTVSVVVSALLVRYAGLDVAMAGVVGVAAGGFAARLYRALRARWPWLRALDAV